MKCAKRPASRFALFMSSTSLVLIGVMTISCGNSSSGGKTACTGGPYDVVGDWSLTLNNDLYSTPGVINSAGLAVFFDNKGDEAVMPRITGACSFSGNLTFYIGQINFGGRTSDPGQGSVDSGPVISGTFSTSTGSQSFVAVPLAPLSGPPTALNSNMTLVDDSSPSTDSLQVRVMPSGIGNSVNMTLSGTDGLNCTVTGTFTQEGNNAANLNVFDTSITFSGTGCPVTGTLAGLGFEASVDYIGFDNATGPFLYALSSSSADVIEVQDLRLYPHEIFLRL
jgi:hypothetical protein